MIYRIRGASTSQTPAVTSAHVWSVLISQRTTPLVISQGFPCAHRHARAFHRFLCTILQRVFSVHRQARACLSALSVRCLTRRPLISLCSVHALSRTSHMYFTALRACCISLCSVHATFTVISMNTLSRTPHACFVTHTRHSHARRMPCFTALCARTV